MNDQIRLTKISDFPFFKIEYMKLLKNIIDLFFHPSQQIVEKRLSEELGVAYLPSEKPY